MMNHKIVRLDPAQIDDAGRALALAFQDDPLQTYTLPDPVERTRLSPAHFAALLRYGQMFGEVFTTLGRPDGAVVWLPPGHWDVTPDRMAASGLDQLPSLLGAEAVARFDRVIEFLKPFHYRDAPNDHWYVMVIGVAPVRQGQGLGRALLQPIMDRAAADHLPCYLETAHAPNVPFYGKLGFEVLADTVEPQSGLRLWTFRRDPV